MFQSALPTEVRRDVPCFVQMLKRHRQFQSALPTEVRRDLCVSFKWRGEKCLFQSALPTEVRRDKPLRLQRLELCGFNPLSQPKLGETISACSVSIRLPVFQSALPTEVRRDLIGKGRRAISFKFQSALPTEVRRDRERCETTITILMFQSALPTEVRRDVDIEAECMEYSKVSIRSPNRS